MSASRAPLGHGLYFLDVLACLLFSITLALAGARFGSETSVPVVLPELSRSSDSVGTDLVRGTITLRGTAERPELFLDERSVSFEELSAQLGASRPPAVVVRAESTPLSRVIAIAHEAGVHDIQLAYDTRAPGEN